MTATAAKNWNLLLSDDLGVETADEGIATVLGLWHEDDAVLGGYTSLRDDDGREVARLTTVQMHGFQDATVEVLSDGSRLQGWWRVRYEQHGDGATVARVLRVG